MHSASSTRLVALMAAVSCSQLTAFVSDYCYQHAILRRGECITNYAQIAQFNLFFRGHSVGELLPGGDDFYRGWVTYSSQGSLPDGLSCQYVPPPDQGTEERHDMWDERYTWYFEHYSVLGTADVSSVVQCQQWAYRVDETWTSQSRGIVSNDIWGPWVSSEPQTKVYSFLFVLDDFADIPADASCMTTLQVQTTWTLDEGWVDGGLFPECRWYEDGQFFEPKEKSHTIPADVDVFKIDADAGVYCIETKVSGSGTPPLDVRVYAADGLAFGELLGSTNQYCVYDDHGDIDQRTQRVYFEAGSAGAYVETKSTAKDFAGAYSIRVFRARPVILVHGIDCPPWDQKDVKAGRDSMGNWRDCLPWDGQAYPCTCYSFSWKSAEGGDPLNPDGTDKIRCIIEEDKKELDNPYVQKAYEKHGNMKVVLIGHSMGGYIVRFALSNLNAYQRIHKAVLMGTPMYGSDVATADITWLAAKLKQTSRHNLLMLRPGSEMVRNMHNWAGKDKCLCFAGVMYPARLERGTTAGLLTGIAYDRGSRDGDGAVPGSSALLTENADSRNFALRRDHGTIGLAAYTPDEHYPEPPKATTTEEILSLIMAHDKSIGRRNKHAMFEDEIYIGVRDHIN